jgi:Zn-dependent peptidase ImmA (M78 family)/transcriptional regulator with XRE-family HTH domain
MTIGVNGFIGERLKEAREARELLTLNSLAGLLGVTNNSISLYEKNEINPRTEMVSKIAGLLRVKESYFFTPMPTSKNVVFWRSTHTTTKDRRTISESRFGWTKLIDAYFKTFLEMPKLNLPSRSDIGVPNDPDDITEEMIEQIAFRCRDYWGLGVMPIPNMTALLENNGVMVSYGTLHSDKLDAFSNESEYDCSYHIFLGIDKKSGLRSRFDSAHELGHLIMHNHLPKSVFLGKNHSFFEKQANRFASSFLMPAKSFKDDVWMPSIEALRTIRSRWNVSIGAMIARCEHLGFFGEQDTGRIWNRYRKNWQNIEDDNFVFETPQLLKRSLDLILSAKIRTKSEILHDLPFMQSDIEEILNLTSGYLDEDFGQIREFPTVKNENLSSTAGKIIQHDFSVKRL